MSDGKTSEEKTGGFDDIFFILAAFGVFLALGYKLFMFSILSFNSHFEQINY